MFYWLRRSWIRGLSRPRRDGLSARSASALGSTIAYASPDVARSENVLPGRLIIVEGNDGSVKSTQLDMLRKWLVNEGYLENVREWTSSLNVNGIRRPVKRKQLLPPMSVSHIHATQ